MSNASMHLSLPYIQGGQAQKHVTHNEALRKLDLAVQLSVRALADAPIAVAEDGDRYIVGASPTAEWAGHTHDIAQFETGAWTFTSPSAGWVAFDQQSGGQVVFTGASWGPVEAGGGSLPELGVNTSSDLTNRFAVASTATLLTHDGAGHQLKVNKAGATDTASLLFQSNWSGRAEMGLTGSDDFEVKVSSDGANFRTALRVSGLDGSVAFPNTALASPAYVSSVAQGLVPNGTGFLGAEANAPSGMSWDRSQTPHLPGSLAFTGHYTGAIELPEPIIVDPNLVYRLTSYIRQGSVAGNWSAYAQGQRHAHSIGLRCYDAEGLVIRAEHHSVYQHGGATSRTVLTAPLAPGDTQLQVADANGWNESDPDADSRGIVIYGYQDTFGQRHDFYSRIQQAGLFDLGDVNKATGVVSLNQPLPAALSNPADSGGVWPVGTTLANRTSGAEDKLAFCDSVVPGQTDQWYQLTHAIGGIDQSGTNTVTNFAPGTAFVKVVLMPHLTNRVGGYAGFPDTGSGTATRISGLALHVDPTAQSVALPSGARGVYVLNGSMATGSVSFDTVAPQIRALS